MPRGAVRDPLSVRYDGATRDLLERAARASRSRRAVIAWVPSPRGEFRRLDRGGRTAHERAWTRSMYYQVRIPPRRWSLKLTWDEDSGNLSPSFRRGWLARRVRIRMFSAGSGYAHAARDPRAWWGDESRRSSVGNRIDQNRQAG